MSRVGVQFEQERSTPQLAITYGGGDSTLLADLLPFVGYVEVSPDTMVRREGDQTFLCPEKLDELKSIGGRAELLVHGEGVSIGSYDGLSDRYLRLLDQLLTEVDISWHSEHLAAATADGTMLALRKTPRLLDRIANRVSQIQQLYPLSFLLESVVDVRPDRDDEYSEAGFLNALARYTGCGLILNLSHLEAAAKQGFPMKEFLDELDLSTVREVHIAAGCECHSFLVDVHSARIRRTTADLLRKLLARPHGIEAITLNYSCETISAVGPIAIVNELRAFQSTLCAGQAMCQVA